MNDKKYSFQLVTTGIGEWSGTPVQIDNFEEFINQLREKQIKKVSFRFYSILDDIPNWWEPGTNIAVDDILPIHFEWLITKDYGQSKHLQIDVQSKKPKAS